MMQREEVTLVPISVVLLSGAVLCALFPTVLLCLRCSRTRSADSERQDEVTLRNKQRVKEEKEARRQTISLVKDLLEKDGTYTFIRELRNLGRRLEKYWMEVEVHSIDKPKERLILTAAPVSKNCTLPLEDPQTIRTLKSLLNEVNKHPNVHGIVDVFYIAEASIVVLIQQVVKEGSLKDVIWKPIEPLSDKSGDMESREFNVSWSKKDYTSGTPLPSDKVALYGKQILEGLKFLKNLHFPLLVHIHTGNIFVVDEKCRIGGYEHTILCYRSRLYNTCVTNNCLEHIELIMFGHVIFEMAAGQEPSDYLLTEEDYDLVEDRDTKEVLKYIFTTKEKSGVLKHSLEKMRSHEFFKRAKYQVKKPQVDLTRAMKDLLK